MGDMTLPKPFFHNFKVHQLHHGQAVIHAEVGGSGPPLLLLHGYPQTHVAWHRIVPTLAKHFTVIAPDLRGYGDSVGPAGDVLHTQYSKRTVALDNLALMQSLGFSRFAVMGHDRGARVGYRMCLDAPQAVNCFVSLTVVPTAEMWKRADMAFGMKAFHWYLFAQPFDLPERLLRSDPSYFLDWTLRNMVMDESAIHSECRAEYHRAFARESVRHAMMEDYRAAASIDLEHDKEDWANGHKVACPVQILWNKSVTASPNPEEIWRTWADQVEGATIDCGHLMAEEAPDEVLQHVLPFLMKHSAL